MLSASPVPAAVSLPQRQGVSLIVPCFEEAAAIEQLRGRIDSIRLLFEPTIELEVIFVDDGSTDDTFRALTDQFGCREWTRVVSYEKNRGIAAAILTGATSAKHDIVVSMDADCTYAPEQINELIAAMDERIVLVTASPYHPLGRVDGVPRWRLSLSKLASRMYGCLLGLKLHTYTSCFRAYRRDQLLDIQLTHDGFVGIAEMLWRLSMRGDVAEVPAVLTSRRVGFSKMRTIPVARAHLKLMLQIFWFKTSRYIFQRRGASHASV